MMHGGGKIATVTNLRTTRTPFSDFQREMMRRSWWQSFHLSQHDSHCYLDFGVRAVRIFRKGPSHAVAPLASGDILAANERRLEIRISKCLGSRHCCVEGGAQISQDDV